MSTEAEPELIAMMRAAQQKSRGLNDFFSWAPARELEEFGVADELRQSLDRKRQASFSELRARGRGNDPPDCEAVDPRGNRVAIEVTELIDPTAIACFKKGLPYNWTDWSREKLVSGLERLLDAKANRYGTLKGGPYRKYVVAIHTDEPMLPFDTARELLHGHRFTRRPTVDRSFLVISYDPKLKCCPVIELQFDA
jgi:hypothetical protein